MSSVIAREPESPQQNAYLGQRRGSRNDPRHLFNRAPLASILTGAAWRKEVCPQKITGK